MRFENTRCPISSARSTRNTVTTSSATSWRATGWRCCCSSSWCWRPRAAGAAINTTISSGPRAAGARYFDAVDAAAADPKASLAALDALGKDVPTGYGLLARFRAAGDLGRTDAPGAVSAFDAIAADAAVAQEFRDVAALRAGVLVVDTAEPGELRRRLEPLADANSSYRSLAREMLAVAALKRGDDAEAGRWLDAIEADPQSAQDSRQRAGFFLGLVRAGKPAAVPGAPASAPAGATP